MIIGLIIIISALALDQVSKILVRAFIELGQTVDVIPNFLIFTNVQNDGAAFGILKGQLWFFIIVTIAALAIFGYLFYQIKNRGYRKMKLYTFGVSFAIAGTLGNAIDRVIFGSVTDFINHGSTPILKWFQVYNIADALLIFGIIFIAIDIFFFFDKRKLKEKIAKNKEGNQIDEPTQDNNRDDGSSNKQA